MNKILRSIGVIAAFTASVGANAQIPDYGVWPAGVILTDIDGNTHDIDAKLDAGTSVLIDAFADWCGPCWTYHTGGTLEDLWASKGDGGSGDVFIIGVEADPSVPESNISDAGTGTGDWTLGGTLDYPLANDDALAGIINLAYYPTLILICPDRSVTEVGQASLSAWESAVDGCGAASTNTNDPKILTSTTATSVTSCGGTATTDIKVVIQNFSTSAISGDYDIEVTDGSGVVASTTATLNLAPYAATEVNIGNVTLAAGTNNFTATITTANDDTSNDSYPITVVASAATDVAVNSSTMEVEVVLDMDAYASEVGFALREGTPSGNAATVWAASNAGNSVAYAAAGSLSGTSFSQTYTIANLGCHYFVTYDSYGDGITYQYAGGHAELNAIGSMNIPGSWGDGDIFGVNFTDGGSGGGSNVIESDIVSNLSIFPNPAVEMTNIQLNLNESANVTIEMINALGQIVYTNNLGEVNGTQNVEINTADLQEGIYLVNIKVGDDVITKRISVIK